MRKITGHPLWLGHAGDVRDPAGLFEAGISAVVCVTASEPPLALPRELVYCRFPLVDGAGNPDWLLRAAVLTVASLLVPARLPSCTAVAGISRSPAIGVRGPRARERMLIRRGPEGGDGIGRKRRVARTLGSNRGGDEITKPPV